MLLQGVDLDNWIEKVKKCQALQEEELKALCEYVRQIFASQLKMATMALRNGSLLCAVVQVKEILVEESNVQPVNSPVTVSCLADRLCLCVYDCNCKAVQLGSFCI